jgi:hypothetical protein
MSLPGEPKSTPTIPPHEAKLPIPVKNQSLASRRRSGLSIDFTSQNQPLEQEINTISPIFVPNPESENKRGRSRAVSIEEENLDETSRDRRISGNADTNNSTPEEFVEKNQNSNLSSLSTEDSPLINFYNRDDFIIKRSFSKLTLLRRKAEYLESISEEVSLLEDSKANDSFCSSDAGQMCCSKTSRLQRKKVTHKGYDLKSVNSGFSYLPFETNGAFKLYFPFYESQEYELPLLSILASMTDIPLREIHIDTPFKNDIVKTRHQKRQDKKLDYLSQPVPADFLKMKGLPTQLDGEDSGPSIKGGIASPLRRNGRKISLTNLTYQSVYDSGSKEEVFDMEESNKASQVIFKVLLEDDNEDLLDDDESENGSPGKLQRQGSCQIKAKKIHSSTFTPKIQSRRLDKGSLQSIPMTFTELSPPKYLTTSNSKEIKEPKSGDMSDLLQLRKFNSVEISSKIGRFNFKIKPERVQMPSANKFKVLEHKLKPGAILSLVIILNESTTLKIRIKPSNPDVQGSMTSLAQLPSYQKQSLMDSPIPDEAITGSPRKQSLNASSTGSMEDAIMDSNGKYVIMSTKPIMFNKDPIRRRLLELVLLFVEVYFWIDNLHKYLELVNMIYTDLLSYYSKIIKLLNSNPSKASIINDIHVEELSEKDKSYFIKMLLANPHSLLNVALRIMGTLDNYNIVVDTPLFCPGFAVSSFDAIQTSQKGDLDSGLQLPLLSSSKGKIFVPMKPKELFTATPLELLNRTRRFLQGKAL